MSDCLEVLFASDNSGGLQTASCYNPHNGATLMTYKGGGGASKNCLSIVGNDYIISADTNKPILHVWPLHSQETSHDLRMVIPGKASCLSMSPDGHYCVAGIDCKIYVWQTASGALLNVITRHYLSINKVIFTDDSSHFVTIGEDSLILVWNLADVVAKHFDGLSKLVILEAKPKYQFSHHSLPVTDVFLGRGSLKSRLFTVSADQTCKIFDLRDGSLLLSIIYNYVLTSVTVNEIETQLFVGSNSGKIQLFNLDPYPRSFEHHVSEETDNIGSFVGHTKAVTSLSTSFDGTTLASGSNDEKVFLWNILSKQLIRSFDMKGHVTNLFFFSASNNIFTNNSEPSLVMNKFEKVKFTEKNSLEINVWVHENLQPITLNDEIEKTEESNENQSKVIEDDCDVASLKDQIVKLKKVNKQLYQFAMNKILKNPLTVGMDETMEIDN